MIDKIDSKMTILPRLLTAIFNVGVSAILIVTMSACNFTTTVAPATTAPAGSAPVAAALTPATFNEDVQSGFITLAYTDDDDDLATTCQISHKNHVTVTTACTCTDGVCTVQVTGETNYNGTASFDYSVTANTQISNVATATFTIAPVPDLPVASAIAPAAFAEDAQSGVITLSYLDPDGDLATTCTTSGLSHITVSQACACVAGVCTLKVTPAANYFGAAGFDYTVTAGGDVSLAAHATLAVTSVDDAPVASAITPAAFNVDVQSGLITLSYTDLESDLAATCATSALTNVTVTQACACTAGVCTLKVTGTAGFYGAASFNYTVTANGTVSNSAAATLTINPSLVTSGLSQNHDANFAISGGTAAYAAGTLNSGNHWYDLLNPTSDPKALGSGFEGGAYSGTGTAASPYALSFTAASAVFSNTSTSPFGSATDFSVELWFKANAGMATHSGLVGDFVNGEIGIFNADGTGYKVVGYSGTVIAGPVAYDTNWTHFVLTGDATKWKLYKNGVFVTQGNSPTLLNSPQDYAIGYGSDINAASDYFFDGKVAIYRTYSRALTAAEALRSCNAFKARYQGATCGP